LYPSNPTSLPIRGPNFEKSGINNKLSDINITGGTIQHKIIQVLIIQVIYIYVEQEFQTRCQNVMRKKCNYEKSNCKECDEAQKVHLLPMRSETGCNINTKK
jgi:hypothetical protein